MKFIEIEEGRWINLDKVEDIIIRKNIIQPNKILKNNKEIESYVVEFYFNSDNYVLKEFITYEEAKAFVEDILRK